MSPFNFIFAALRSILGLRGTPVSAPVQSLNWPHGPIAQFEILAAEERSEKPTNFVPNFGRTFTKLLRQSESSGSLVLSVLQGQTHLITFDIEPNVSILNPNPGAILGLSDKGPFIRNDFESTDLFVVRPEHCAGQAIAVVQPKGRFHLRPGDRVHIGSGAVIYCPAV